MNPARLVSLLSPQSVDPRRDQAGGVSTSPARWRSSDVGIALGGLREPYVSAARWRWSRDESCLPLLERELGAYATAIAARDEWRLTFRRNIGVGITVSIEIAAIVRIALLEEHFAELSTTVAKAELLGINEKSWRHHLAPGYAALRVEIETWNSIARAHVARRIGHDDG